MNRTISFFILLGLVLGASCNNDSALEIPDVPASAIPSEPGDYAGSETCKTCHQSIYQTWANSRHTSKVRDASLDVLVNDYNVSGESDFEKGGAGITFNVGTSLPADQTAFTNYVPDPGVDYPMLGFDGTDILIRIGPNTYVVDYVLGGTGKWKQRYMVTIDNQEYISPVQWNEISRQYVWYHPEHWYTINGDRLTGYLYNAGQTPVTEGKTRNSWQRRCIACHVTGVRNITKNANGEYGAAIVDMEGADTGADAPYFLEKPISCEACHGPSSRHVELGGGIGTTINPNTMAADRGDEICGACHNRGTSANAEGFGYPWKEGTLVDGQFRPGDVLDELYTHVDRDGSRFWGDGARSAKSHHQQWIEHRDTPHGKAGVTCWKCHDPHGSQVDGDLKMPVQQLCLSCHDGKNGIDSANLALHTKHTSPEAQQCNYCHFVQTAKSAIAGDISSHTYRLIYPLESEGTPGLPNSCGECHADRTIDQLNGMLASRFPGVRPVAYASSSMIGTSFRLSGEQSFDPLGAPLGYQWSLVTGPPAASQTDLIGATGESAIFVPTAPGKYTFQLVVTNVDGVKSSPTQVSVDAAETSVQATPDLREAQYMGSGTCRICHPQIHSTAAVARHKQKVRRPDAGLGVVFADTDNDGTSDWFQGGAGGFDVRNDADSENTTFDNIDFGLFDPPHIRYNAATDTYEVRIGPVTYDVTWVLGGTGKWKQRYMATIGEGEYIMPIQVNELTNEWVPYHLDDWYFLNGAGDTVTGYVYTSAAETPVTEGNTRDSWQRRCTTCHATGARDMTQDPVTKEYAKSIEVMLAAATGPRLAEAGLGCESCHGPGSFHVNSPVTNGAIINPSKLSTLRANEACGQCHNRGTSVNDGGFGFPWGEATVDGHYIPGEDLNDFYTPKAENSSSFWPDPYGHAKQHHQQWLDFRWTGHYDSGMSCATCHNSHEDNLSGQLRAPANQLCKTCHPNKIDNQGAEENHSRHPNGSPGNKCSTCHYVYVAKSAVNYDVSAHSAQIIYPVTSQALSDAGGTPIPNSCMTAGCHSSAIGDLMAWSADDEDANAEATQRIGWMWGDIAPIAIARVFEANGNPLSIRQATFTAPVTVTLDGARSYDPNGKKITSHAWTLLKAPAGSSAFLKTRLIAQPTININVPGTYTFSLVVRDSEKSSKPQTVTITVE